MQILYILLTGLGSYLTLYVSYELLLLSAHLFLPNRQAARHSLGTTRFGIVVPAHNEELLLARLLKSLNSQSYPREKFTVIVIADNCTDKTAQICLDCRAIVWERSDVLRRGKGHAIRFALEKIDLSAYDAFVIIDADSVVGEDMLQHLGTMIENGRKIIQCYNGVANPNSSWFTRLLDVSRSIGNEIYHPAKEKLNLSSYLMGNGMCFSREVLMKYGWDAFTVGEDWEYYAKLVLAGETIAFANGARVYHQESSSLKQATTQRMRWSSGRFAVACKYGTALFLKGVVEKDIKKMDASLPLLLPNPSLGMNLALAGAALALLPAFRVHESGLLLWFSSLALVQVFFYLIGAAYTRHKIQNVLSLFAAPIFLIWKMGIDAFAALGLGRKKWIRTERKL